MRVDAARDGYYAVRPTREGYSIPIHRQGFHSPHTAPGGGVEFGDVEVVEVGKETELASNHVVALR